MTWLLAPFYDHVMEATEHACLGDWRDALLQSISGVILEIGAGTGANLPHYPPHITDVVLAEPDAAMRKQLRAKLISSNTSVFRVSDASGEALPYDNETFDSIVSTLVLCSVDSLEQTLSELYRVLKPGGCLHFIEHVLSPDKPARARWQKRISPIWQFFAGGCHCDRDTESQIKYAGFVVNHLHRESIRKAPPFVRPSIRGIALKPIQRS
jgi:ubiquinone/menaquinone biosynthesis C-methylase UbiE